MYWTCLKNLFESAFFLNLAVFYFVENDQDIFSNRFWYTVIYSVEEEEEEENKQAIYNNRLGTSASDRNSGSAG